MRGQLRPASTPRQTVSTAPERVTFRLLRALGCVVVANLRKVGQNPIDLRTNGIICGVCENAARVSAGWRLARGVPGFCSRFCPVLPSLSRPD